MGRLAPLDKALVWILVPLWLAWFALGLKTQIEGGGIALLGISRAAPDANPTLTGDFSVLYSWDPLEQAGLRPGDVLLRAGTADLRGASHPEFVAHVAAQQAPDLRVALHYERDGERRETELTLLPVSLLRPWLACSFAFGASALFLRLRARPTRTVRMYFLAAFATAFTASLVDENLLTIHLSIAVLVLGGSVGFPLFIRFAQLFLDDGAGEARWSRTWPWLFCLGAFNALAYYFGRYAIADVGVAVNAIVAGAAIFAVATQGYRRADPIGRRQIRWVVVGGYCAVLPIVLGTAAAAADPRFGPLLTLSYWGVPFFPLFLIVSVLSYNLFDVDRVLSAAASYNVLAVLFVGSGLALVPRASAAAAEALAVDPQTSQLAISLLLAGLVVPANRRLRPQIDRLFFAERYALDQGIEDLLHDLVACDGPDAVTRLTGERLHTLLRPESCVIYARAGQGYVPVFAEGAVIPPGFEPDSPLVADLRRRRRFLALEGAGRRADAPDLSAIDRAALATLGTAVVVPVLRGDDLLSFLCLGPKGSGDVYTPTDLTLLGAVANSVSSQLMRFDQEALARESRTMQESLRRYVPGAVAEELASGAELASGEREISILFVDIRGYTGFSEARRAEEIFSTVNRYTEKVSEIVRHRAGSVVEFNGDGMMAVFGAPRALDDKERAAVEAGCEIAAAVATLPVPDAGDGRTTLSVGVGIATGVEFVGNIQAADRMIWTAIGNTTNLAARLQGLTRDLDAQVVIDAETFDRAGPAAGAFVKRPGVPIRGRRDAQDVYALPLPEAP